MVRTWIALALLCGCPKRGPGEVVDYARTPVDGRWILVRAGEVSGHLEIDGATFTVTDRGSGAVDRDGRHLELTTGGDTMHGLIIDTDHLWVWGRLRGAVDAWRVVGGSGHDMLGAWTVAVIGRAERIAEATIAEIDGTTMLTIDDPAGREERMQWFELGGPPGERSVALVDPRRGTDGVVIQLTNLDGAWLGRVKDDDELVVLYRGERPGWIDATFGAPGLRVEDHGWDDGEMAEAADAEPVPVDEVTTEELRLLVRSLPDTATHRELRAAIEAALEAGEHDADFLYRLHEALTEATYDGVINNEEAARLRAVLAAPP